MKNLIKSMDRQEIIRWMFLVGIGLPVTGFIVCALLSSPEMGYGQLAAIILTGYLGTVGFCAAAHFRPKFLRAGVASYVVFTFGIMLSYQVANPMMVNSCNCWGHGGFDISGIFRNSQPDDSNDGDHNAIVKCF